MPSSGVYSSMSLSLMIAIMGLMAWKMGIPCMSIWKTRGSAQASCTSGAPVMGGWVGGRMSQERKKMSDAYPPTYLPWIKDRMGPVTSPIMVCLTALSMPSIFQASTFSAGFLKFIWEGSTGSPSSLVASLWVWVRVEFAGCCSYSFLERRAGVVALSNCVCVLMLLLYSPHGVGKGRAVVVLRGARVQLTFLVLGGRIPQARQAAKQARLLVARGSLRLLLLLLLLLAVGGGRHVVRHHGPQGHEDDDEEKDGEATHD